MAQKGFSITISEELWSNVSLYQFWKGDPWEARKSHNIWTFQTRFVLVCSCFIANVCHTVSCLSYISCDNLILLEKMLFGQYCLTFEGVVLCLIQILTQLFVHIMHLVISLSHILWKTKWHFPVYVTKKLSQIQYKMTCTENLFERCHEKTCLWRVCNQVRLKHT